MEQLGRPERMAQMEQMEPSAASPPQEPTLLGVLAWEQPFSWWAWEQRPLELSLVLLEVQARAPALVELELPVQRGEEQAWEQPPAALAQLAQVLGQPRMQNVLEGVSPQGVRSSTRRNVRTHPSR